MTVESVFKHFIPISTQDIIQDLSTQVDDPANFERLCRLITTLYHLRTHQLAQNIKNDYLPYSPDTDIIGITPSSLTPEKKTADCEMLIERVKHILQQANYQHLSDAALQDALAQKCDGVEVHIDLHDFEYLAVYYRGRGLKTEQQRDWRSFFLKFKSVTTPTFRRLFLLIKPKPIDQRARELMVQKNLSFEKAEKYIIKSRTLLGGEAEGEHIHFKLFKDIPCSDLEILFPNIQVKMRSWDKIKLSITGGGGTIGGIVATITKISAATNMIGAIIAIGGFAGVLWRQVTTIFALHTQYLATLAKRLYFHNLDNNMGAIMHLIEMAEAEERKETILAYYFLHQSNAVHDLKQLDQAIEAYIQARCGLAIDFELSDALAKLKALAVLTENAEGQLTVIPPEQAQNLLLAACESLLDTP